MGKIMLAGQNLDGYLVNYKPEDKATECKCFLKKWINKLYFFEYNPVIHCTSTVCLCFSYLRQAFIMHFTSIQRSASLSQPNVTNT